MIDNRRHRAVKFARTSFLGALVAILFGTVTTRVSAQEPDEFNAEEVVKKINEDLEKILKDMSTLSGAGAAETGERVVENIDKLLEQMQKSQGDVVKNIDELIKNIKTSPSGSGGSGQQQSQKKPQKSGKQGSKQQVDRNQAEGQKDRKEGGQKKEDEKKQGGSEPKPGEEKKDGEGDPESAEKSDGEKSQSREGRRMKDRNPEKVDHNQVLEAWGFYPNEVKQKLIEGNFRDFFPNYEREISEYLKSLNKKK